MIKRAIILMMLSLVIIAQSENTAEAVNIRELVQKQIDEAKKKEAAQKNTVTEATETPVTKQQQKPVQNRTTKYVNVGETDNSMLGKILILSSFSTIILTIVAFRRSKLKKKDNTDLKTNVRLMREEKFIKPIDPKLKKIRTSLCLNSKYLNKSDAEITNTARKYNIAKSELVLAARFRNQTIKAN